MKATELAAHIARKYGVHPPEGSSYDDLIRLRSMLFRHGKPKKQSSLPVFNPPPCEEQFRVEEEPQKIVEPTTQAICPVSLTPRTEAFMANLPPIADIQTPRVLTYSECPLSDEDGSESPTIGSKKVFSWPDDSPLKRPRF